MEPSFILEFFLLINILVPIALKEEYTMSEKVLVIDDDEEFANLLGLLLSKKGFETQIAFSGVEGINKAASFKPSVIIQDLMLPDVLGMELLIGLKRSSPSSRIIAISGRGDEAIAVDIMKGGASDYLKKPFESQKLFSAISKALNLMPPEQELQKLTREVAHHNKEFFALNAFSAALLAIKPPEERYMSVLEIVMNSMGGTVSALRLADQDGGKLYAAVSGGGKADELKTCCMSRNVGLVSYVFEIKKPAVVRNFAEEKRFLVPEEIKQHGIKSGIAAPLIVKGVVRGVLGLFSAETREYNSSDIKLISSFANSLALSIDNDSLSAVLAAFQAQWQTVLDAMPHRINIQDTDHTIIMANESIAKWAKFQVREIVGQKCSWVLCSMKEPMLNCPVKEAVRTKKPISRKITADGQDFMVHANPIMGPDGEVEMVVERVEDF